MPGRAPPVTNGLQIDQALDFQRRFERVQRVAWWILAAIPVAAVAGLFGGGLFSETTAGAQSSGLTVTYDRFGRLSADTQMEVQLARASGSANVAISRDFLDRYDITEIRPHPERVATLADRVVFSFAAEAGGVATISLQPDEVGSSGGTVTATGTRPVRIRQLVYP
jgi:hypothetical protein